MNKTIIYGEHEKGHKKIENLRKFLKENNADELFIRTTYVSGGWHDIEFDANQAGYYISRTFLKEWEDKHQFSEAYHLWRREN